MRLVGLTREELIGLREPFPFVPEDQRAAYADHLRQMEEDEYAGSDFYLIRSSGRRVPVIASSSSFHDIYGAAQARVTTFKDVSDRRRAGEALRREAERIAALVESAPDAVVIADRNGTIQRVNSEALRLFGYLREELLGRDVETLMLERYVTAHKAFRAAYIGAPRRRPMGKGRTLTGRRKDGSEFPVDVALSTLETDEGPVLIAFVRDITVLREFQRDRARPVAEAERRATDLARSNAELEQFAYIASHDLAEPLRSISGFTQLLQRRYEGQLDEDADRFIGFVVDGVNRMQALISDLLAFSRAGRIELTQTRVDLAELTARVVASLAPMIAEAGAEVAIDPLPIVSGDETKLTQLIQNLIANALKFHAADTAPHVTISSRDHGEMVEIAVADNGVGIDPVHRERIFKMFQRLHGREEYAGTGIGLAVCQRIVERHGGRIWCEGNEPNGSVFRFTVAHTDPETTPVEALAA